MGTKQINWAGARLASSLFWFSVALSMFAAACGSTGDSSPKLATEESDSQDEAAASRQVAGLDVLWNRSLGIECDERAGEPELGYGAVGWIVLDELPSLVGAAEAIDGRSYGFETTAGFAVGDAIQHVGVELTRPVDTVVLRGSQERTYRELESAWTPDLQAVVVYFAPTEVTLESSRVLPPDIGTLKALLVMNEAGDVGVVARDVDHWQCTSVHDLERQVDLWVDLHRLDRDDLGGWFLPRVESTEADSLAAFVLSGHENQTQRILLRREWMARPVAERHFGEPGVPPRVRQRISGRMLAVGLPLSWTEVGGALCSRTAAGWGDTCAPFSSGYNGGQIVGLSVQQFDDQPVEVMLVADPNGFPHRDGVSLGFVGDINETNMHPVPVNGEDIDAQSFEEIRQLVESGQAFIGRRGE